MPTKLISLMNIPGSYNIATNSVAFNDELNWIKRLAAPVPSQALFIPYAYNGTSYATYFSELTTVFTQNGIRLTDINSGIASSLIASAEMIVIGEGDIRRFILAMNQLITQTFNPYNAIANRFASGIPILAWNEGTALLSPKPFSLPSIDLTTTIGASPFQVVNNYTVSLANQTLIKTFLQNNVGVSKVICLNAAYKADKITARLEDSGGGILQTSIPPYPAVINYFLLNGQLQEN